MVNDIKNQIRTINDFPKAGIAFRDITTALKDPQTLKNIIDMFAQKFAGQKIDLVAGIESRGFIFATALAYKLNAGFVPIRKAGKLPAATISESYDLEYGSDTIEMHLDAMNGNHNVLLIDDLLATGGTALAACRLIKKTGANLLGAAFFIELKDLNGKQKLLTGLTKDQIFSIVEF